MNQHRYKKAKNMKITSVKSIVPFIPVDGGALSRFTPVKIALALVEAKDGVTPMPAEYVIPLKAEHLGKNLIGLDIAEFI